MPTAQSCTYGLMCGPDNVCYWSRICAGSSIMNQDNYDQIPNIVNNNSDQVKIRTSRNGPMRRKLGST